MVGIHLLGQLRAFEPVAELSLHDPCPKTAPSRSVGGLPWTVVCAESPRMSRSHSS